MQIPAEGSGERGHTMAEQSEVMHTDAIDPGEIAAGASRRGARNVLVIAAVAVLTVALVALGVVAVTGQRFVSSGKIARNVTMAGVDVAGMTAEEADQAIEQQWVPTLPEQVSVTYPDGQHALTPEELGAMLMIDDAVAQALKIGREGGMIGSLRTRVRLWREGIDVPVRRQVDNATLQEALAGIAPEVDRAPVNARISVRGNDVEIVSGKVGRKLDVEASAAAIAAALADPTLSSVAAVVRTTQPHVTEEDLAHVEVVLSSYTTKFKPYMTDRTHNLRLASQALNQSAIKPGEVFSLNGRIGERLEERGYRAAPIFLEGQVRPSTGGGVCQVASTTYNAALLANLDIVERHHHSRPVDYVPTGRDATVYWGQYDLKVKNNLTDPVVLITEMGENTLTLKFLGSREDDYDVELSRSGLSRVGYGTQEVPDPELAEGKKTVEKPGRSGWRVDVFRKVTRNGEVVREQKLHSDYYSPQTEVVRVGTKKPEPPPVPATPGAPTPSAPTPPAPAPGGSAGSATPAPTTPAPGAGRTPEE